MPLHLELNNTLIKRQDPAWNIEVSDQRGSIPTGKKQSVDRQDWTILVSATPFKDKQNNSLDGALSTTFVKDKQRQDLSSSELKIESHAVTGETPQTHSTSVIQWNENEGLQAIVHDRSKLNTGRDYTSTLTFELRTGP